MVELQSRDGPFLFTWKIERRPNMSEKRRDNRGRILHTGEVQLSTLNVYTHVKFEDAKAEIERIANV